MNKEFEKSIIYNRYIDLFYYSYNIMKKFPKYERNVLWLPKRNFNKYKSYFFLYKSIV